MDNDTLDRRLRDVLRDQADELGYRPLQSAAPARRARRRLVRNTTLGALVVILVMATTISALLSTLPLSSEPVSTPSLTPNVRTPSPTAGRSIPPPDATVGRRAFVRYGDLWAVSWHGGHAHLRWITHDGNVQQMDGWFPDGRSVLIERGSQDRRELVKVDLGAVPAETPLLPGSGIGHGALSPDGSAVAYCAKDGIRIATLTDGATRLLASPGCLGSPSWSPDGSLLAFERLSSHDERGGIASLNIAGQDGAGLQVVARAPFSLSSSGPPLGFVWSPDGARLAFVSGTWIDVVDLATRTTHHLVSPQRQGWDRFALDIVPGWSPDGRWLFFSIGSEYPDESLAVVDTTSGETLLVGQGISASIR